MKAKIFTFLLTFCCLSQHLHAQIITTIAGNGGAIYGDGPATASGFSKLWGITLDNSDNIYIADQGCNRILKIDIAGIILRICGSSLGTGPSGFSGDGGIASSALIHTPCGLIIDNLGDLLLCDAGNLRMRKIDLSGTDIINTIGGTGIGGVGGEGIPATAADLNLTFDVKTDCSNNVFFISSVYVFKIDISTGILHWIAGIPMIGTGYMGDGLPATVTGFLNPQGLAIDETGNIYLSDTYTARIRIIDTAGIVNTVVGTGFGGFSGDGGPATAANISAPMGLAFDNAGNLYFADEGAHRIRKVSTNGVITTIAGNGVSGYSGDGGPATAAQLFQPKHLAVDALGNVYFTDYRRVRKISSNNHIPFVPTGTPNILAVCKNSVNNSLFSTLAITDIDTSQTITWLLLNGPVHGSAVGFSATASSTGGVVHPVGAVYTPNAGYLGLDSFKVKIHDGTSAIRRTIYINVITPSNAGLITGIDSLCPGDTAVLAETILGGIWTSTDASIATVSNVGQLTGISSGNATINYIVSNECSSDTAIFPIIVQPASSCVDNIVRIFGTKTIKVYPNPSSGSFTVSLPSSDNITLEIINIIGSAYKTISVRGKTEEIFNDIPPGIYMVKATSNDIVYRKKVVVLK